ncbi:hypothetical protein MUY27_03385 [Mucilaginibacter sp. RS28]|uniref:Uncharacterized protein n=1 Tax=Mucilaginibacter straminoryzae TaxID=2932774 RepID=A0A9X1X2F0_9SPHI|nr:hypothetical protein [Mucilaginibacter straminoryzae]MCJ8208735.1 hypothetical protein [Mucilaginibacter straminoryzae]
MESFEVQIGAEQRKLRIEPVADHQPSGEGKAFKVFATDINADWLSNPENETATDVPTSDYLGLMTIQGEKKFTFDGEGRLTGNDLLGIAAQIVRHPSTAGYFTI